MLELLFIDPYSMPFDRAKIFYLLDVTIGMATCEALYNINIHIIIIKNTVRTYLLQINGAIHVRSALTCCSQNDLLFDSNIEF